MPSANLASFLGLLYCCFILSKLVTVLQVLNRRLFGEIGLSDFPEYTPLIVLLSVTIKPVRKVLLNSRQITL